MTDADEERATRRARPPLDAERIEQIRARIDAGVYASDPVLRAAARAILERGGLE